MSAAVAGIELLRMTDAPDGDVPVVLLLLPLPLPAPELADRRAECSAAAVKDDRSINCCACSLMRDEERGGGTVAAAVVAEEFVCVFVFKKRSETATEAR